MVLTLRLSVLYGLHGPSKTLTYWSRVTEVESVYSAVWTEFLYKTDKYRVYSAVRTESLYKTNFVFKGLMRESIEYKQAV